MNSSQPAAAASSRAYWMIGLSTTGSISLGSTLVAGSMRVPSPATGNTTFLTGFIQTPQSGGQRRVGDDAPMAIAAILLPSSRRRGKSAECRHLEDNTQGHLKGDQATSRHTETGASGGVARCGTS